MNSLRKNRILTYGLLQRFFPIWTLKRQRKLSYAAYEELMKKVQNDPMEVNEIEHQQHWEDMDYEEAIFSIQSRRLAAEARAKLIHVPDLVWEQGNSGARFLDRASLSKLNAAVKEHREKKREFYFKLIAAVIASLGTLIAFLAYLKKT